MLYKKKIRPSLIKSIRFCLFFIICLCFLDTKIISANNNNNNNNNLCALNKNYYQDILFNKNKNKNQKLEVIPCGIIIGVKINTDGLITLNQQKIKALDKNVLPARKIYQDDSNIKPIKSQDKKNINKNIIKAGIQDFAQGIGTMTYYNPITNKFGALGHGITDTDTQKLIKIKSGDITKSNQISIIKAERGIPGEILGDINFNQKLGDIKLNNDFGIYGLINIANIKNNIPSKKMPIALKNEIHEGPAYILSNIANNQIKYYNAFIENINKFSLDDSKNMIIRITDQDLLNQTNGIIQGMSGSPIIQDNKLIGAVTHVFINEPTRGYAIFIENMIKQEALA